MNLDFPSSIDLSGLHHVLNSISLSSKSGSSS